VADRKSIIRVQFLADASQLDREMRRAEGTTESVGKKMSDFGKAAVAYLGAQALGAVKEFVGDSVRAFSELEQSQGGTQAVFGESAKVIDDFAKRSAQAIGLSEAEFRTATTLIGGQLKRMTGDVNFAAEQSVELTRVAADLAATYGGTTAEAVEALGAAFRGEADPAERFNLNLKASVVNAKAVEMGLAATEKEVDDNARAQALLALIMEQSADAQGQFARELDTVAGKAQVAAAEAENMKARVGEALVPVKELSTELGMVAAQAAGILATKLQNLTGAIDDVDSAIQQFEIHMGISADSAQAAITIAKEWGVSLLDLVDRLDLTKEELEILKENLDFATEATGMSEEAAAELAEVLESKLHHAQVLVDEQAARGASEWLRNRDAMEEAEDQADDLTEAVEDQIDALTKLREAKRRDADATFNLIEASREAEEAQKAYTEAVKKHGATSDEAVEAAAELYSKQQDLIDAALTFRDEAGPNWEQGFRQQMESAGVSADTIQRIIDKVKDLEGTIRDVNGSTIDIKANVRVPKFRFDQKGNYVTPSQIGTAVFQHGGVVTGPTMGLIGEAGSSEAVIPLNRQGMEFLVKALRETIAPIVGPSSGVGQPVNITVNALDPRAAARAVVEALQEYERGNGPIPIQVRSA
jgi:hypothetical protein